MKTLALAGAMFLALLSPAFAQQQCFELEAVMESEFLSRGLPAEELTPEKVAEGAALFGVEGATRAFVAINADGRALFGFEVNGCLIPPIYLNAPAPAALHLSGRYPFGTFA